MQMYATHMQMSMLMFCMCVCMSMCMHVCVCVCVHLVRELRHARNHKALHKHMCMTRT